MTTSLVRYEICSPAIVLTIQRSEKRNALSRDLIAQLHQAFEKAEADPLGRVVILTGEGTAFCAGMDLDELRSTLNASEEIVWDDARHLAELFDKIYRLSKPTIAAINGHAVAGGAGLVTVCDLAIGVSSAKFGYPEVKRGLVAAMVMPHLLRHLPERYARQLLLTGDLIDAAQAKDWGLIQEVVDTDSLMTRAMQLANSLAEGGPLALKVTKELLARFSHQALTTEEAAKASAEPRLGEECRQGLAAFFEKRPAPWIGK